MNGQSVETVRVELGERSYDILVGPDLLRRSGEILAGEILAGRFRSPRAVVVTDETVAGLHLGTLTAGLEAAGVRSDTVVVPSGEASKEFGSLAHVLE